MLPVLIAGGGIGGLTLALALARHGVASRVFEARDQPPGEGAGIQLGPNATRILQTLSLADALAPHVNSPKCIIVNDGVSGRELTRLPLGSWIERRHGAPYWVVHRAQLHEVLWQAAEAEPLIAIEAGRTVSSIDDLVDADNVTIGFADGGEAAGRLLVGADGLWSQVRSHVDPGFELMFEGVAAARAVIPRNSVGPRFSEMATGVWMAPSAHVVHYPIDGGDRLAIVAIGASEVPSDGWSSAVSNDDIAARFAQMPDAVRKLLAAANDWRQWPLYRSPGAASLSKGRTVLIGDAAHPILPYLAQGGAMAIEDAFELAGLIAGTGENPAQALPGFGERRRRAERIQATSVENGRAYHLNGIAAMARNAALRTLPGSIFMRRYDWIYGYRSN